MERDTPGPPAEEAAAARPAGVFLLRLPFSLLVFVVFVTFVEVLRLRVPFFATQEAFPSAPVWASAGDSVLLRGAFDPSRCTPTSRGGRFIARRGFVKGRLRSGTFGRPWRIPVVVAVVVPGFHTVSPPSNGVPDDARCRRRPMRPVVTATGAA